jgi:hypothetical protein
MRRHPGNTHFSANIIKPMVIQQISEEECKAILADASFGQLGCSSEDQPYVVPITFAYEAEHLYVFSTPGQKIEWMRKNPKVCVQVTKIENETAWVSVIVIGSYQELRQPQYTEERTHARKLLEKHVRWWQTALAERQSKSDDELIQPLLFRIHVGSLTGLRAGDK